MRKRDRFKKMCGQDLADRTLQLELAIYTGEIPNLGSRRGEAGSNTIALGAFVWTYANIRLYP